MKFKVALFDMAGTTVDDMVEKPGAEGKLPLVISAYQDAFKQGNIVMPFEELNDCRGRNKLEVFDDKVGKYRGDLSPEAQKELAQRLHDDEFVPALLANVKYTREMPGTTETFKALKENGIYIATGSGFPQVVTDAINNQLGWQESGLVDFGTCGNAAGGGRPHPNMINATLVAAGYLPEGNDLSQRVEGFDYGMVLKVGDTVKDIEEGQSVGAYTIAVCSGTQKREKLLGANPDVVLESVRDVPSYIERI